MSGPVVKQVFIQGLARSRKGYFTPLHLFPVYKKDEQAHLYEIGEAEKFRNAPIRPPKVYQTCSVFNDELVNKFTNYIMEDGKKQLARSQLEKTFENVKRAQIEKYHNAKNQAEKDLIELDPRNVFHMAVGNCKPLLQLVAVKRGGITYQVPVPITDNRSIFLAMNWLVEAGKDKFRTKRFADQLCSELIDASNNTGRVVARKQDLHKQCEANRAYAHYRWQ